jgi:hypothetical protein
LLSVSYALCDIAATSLASVDNLVASSCLEGRSGFFKPVMASATLLLQNTVERSGRARSFRRPLWRHICVINCAIQLWYVDAVNLDFKRGETRVLLMLHRY